MLSINSSLSNKVYNIRTICKNEKEIILETDELILFSDVSFQYLECTLFESNAEFTAILKFNIDISTLVASKCDVKVSNFTVSIESVKKYNHPHSLHPSTILCENNIFPTDMDSRSFIINGTFFCEIIDAFGLDGPLEIIDGLFVRFKTASGFGGETGVSNTESIVILLTRNLLE